MKEKVLKAVNTVANAGRLVKLIGFAVICTVTVILSLVFSGVKIGYTVKYGGNKIATVDKKSDFDYAKSLALEQVDTENKEGVLYAPVFTPTLSLPDNFENIQDLASAILDNTAELENSAALNVNGENVAFAKTSDELNELADKRLNAYNVENAENSAEFLDEVEIKSVYCKTADYTETQEIAAQFENLSVKTTAQYKSDVAVAFSTVTEKSAQKLVGYRAVTCAGEEGLNQNIEEVIMVNGNEIERNVLDQVVVKEPVDRVVVIGVASSSTAALNKSASGGMVFPLPKGSGYTLTTYFGEYDGSHAHKGVDYAVSKGTSIYAVKGGTVLTAGFKSDYGNYVIINHGDGIKTLYAHCSELYVSAGQEVSQGQTIATVGNTGWSTGNHLHFEVIVNGSYANPLNYIG